MIFEVNIDKLFREIEEKVIEEQRNIEEKIEYEKEDKSLESPEDAKETQEVHEPTSKETEESHGGDEASKEIKDSPNAVKDGENSEREKKVEEGKNENKENEETNKYEGSNNGQEGQGKGTGDKNKEGVENKDINGEGIPEKGKKDGKQKNNTGGIGNSNDENDEKKNERQDEYYITGSGKNPSKIKPVTTPEELEEQIKEMFERKRIQEELAKKENKDEYLKKYMIEIIKKIAAKHAGIVSLLAKQGYDCHLAACGNGFYSRDMIEDKVYNTRKTLENYNAGEVSKIACPTPETAAKMANEAEFSIILADFDGLSSICKMASLCNSDKVPYLFCTEDRYSWEDPAAHNWVDPDMCEYDPKLVYDVSIGGNPELEIYNDMEEDYYDRDYDD